MLWKTSQDLPDYESLAKYEPPVMTRIHAHDGTLIAEYARERRIFVPINTIPKLRHRRLPVGRGPPLLRARRRRLPGHRARRLQSRREQDPTRRQARPRAPRPSPSRWRRTSLLTSERSVERKLKEAILAIRIERAYSKDKILELYLNEIYLGIGSYGVAAAA